MTDAKPVACSLGASALEDRLAAISALGEKALISREEAGGRHLLRFRAEDGAGARLASIVEAEGRCCPFLELELRSEGRQLLLSIGAPPEGRAVADALAAAFGN